MLNYCFLSAKRTSPKVYTPAPAFRRMQSPRGLSETTRDVRPSEIHRLGGCVAGRARPQEARTPEGWSRRNGKRGECARPAPRPNRKRRYRKRALLCRALAHSAIRRAAGGLMRDADCAPQWEKARKQGGKGCRRSQGESAPTTPQK